MSQGFRFGVVLPWFLLVFSGCVSNRYEVELTPEGKSLKREITVWKAGGEGPDNVKKFSKDELENIAKAYDADVPRNLDQKHTFSGAFAGEMPRDVGGNGSFTHWETSLGTLSMYVERFRGNDDLMADFESRMKACDQIVTLLTGWLESELKDDPGFPPLKKFLDGEFRRDVKNLSLLAWTFTNHKPAQADDVALTKWAEELLVRTSQYLIERGYFTSDQVPVFYRAIVQEDPDQLLEFFKRFVATKMGMPKDQPLPKSLAFLDDPKVFEASVKKHLDRSPEYQKLVAAYDPAAADANLKPPKPSDVLVRTLLGAFPVLRIADDRLTVKLNVPVEPTLTNGQWDAKEKRVRWSRPLLAADSKSSEFPAMCYALWSEPNSKTQTERFGKVVLEGQNLAKYCLWHRGLSEAEAKEWDTFLQGLKPGTDLVFRLRNFRFSDQAGTQHNKDRLAEEPRELLLEGLGTEVE